MQELEVLLILCNYEEVDYLKKHIIKVNLIWIKALLKCIDDILLFAGVVLISKGVFQIYVPAGYITLGICFIAFAFFIAKRR